MFYIRQLLPVFIAFIAWDFVPIVYYLNLQATIEHRKLAVDLAEVIIKWEVQRMKEDMEMMGEVTLQVDYSLRINYNVDWVCGGNGFSMWDDQTDSCLKICDLTSHDWYCRWHQIRLHLRAYQSNLQRQLIRQQKLSGHVICLALWVIQITLCVALLSFKNIPHNYNNNQNNFK